VTSSSFRQRLAADTPVLLDGPVGTELDLRGVATRLPLWSAWGLIESPDTVRAIHRDHVDAGAEVIITNTFRTHRRSLAKAGYGARAPELTGLAVGLAREARAEARRPAWVAGSIAPLEDCYSPELTPSDDELEREHGELVDNLEAAGVDLYVVETMPSIREARAATVAALATGRPVLVGFVCDAKGVLLSGESLASAAAALEPLGPSALMVNCTPYDTLHRALGELRAATSIPLGAYGNVGHAEDECGWEATAVATPADYGAAAERWLDSGAHLVGCCCGTRPEHLAAVARMVRGRSAHLDGDRLR
jgi:S-methylmethionine-dependent homocysteine/selenocysteine methylase